MSHPFKISDKVVCIHTNWLSSYYTDFDHLPYRGEVCVVRGIDPGSYMGGFYLCGFTGCIGPDGYETSFHPRYFRKLEEIQAEHRVAHTRSIGIENSVMTLKHSNL